LVGVEAGVVASVENRCQYGVHSVRQM
jgi:hypothetical protein